jgi:hypothetical protein
MDTSVSDPMVDPLSLFTNSNETVCFLLYQRRDKIELPAVKEPLATSKLMKNKSNCRN